MILRISLIHSCFVFLGIVAGSFSGPPTAKTINGTYSGLRLESFDQDAFFGIPFAQAPVGDLRLRHSIPYNQSWSGVRNSTMRYDSCPGFDAPFKFGFADGLTLGEDCLTLDIVRPTITKSNDSLPVFVWIYGGGFKAGGSADPRYNTSYIVRNSMDMQKPIITVVLNYRTMSFGFMASKEVAAAGVANIGLLDQRLALRWIQENIKAFGGDPNRVTIGGESAGGSSVGYQMVANEGRNDNLFQGAIMESASLLGAGMRTPLQLNTTYQEFYDNITTTVGCNTAVDSLACLRTIPFPELYNASIGFQFKPIIDGKFISLPPSQSIKLRQIADVAVIIGSNTDEGTAEFFTPRGTLNSDTDITNFVAGQGGGLNKSVVDTILNLYPDDPEQGCPFGTGLKRFESQGFQYKRGAAISGDLAIHAGRRSYAADHAKRSRNPLYTYRFNQAPWDMMEVDVAVTEPVYVTHFTEIVYVFDNPNANVNAVGPYPSYHRLQKFISRAWVSFIHDLNPNNHGLNEQPRWPEYSVSSPKNIVFQAGGCYVEDDIYRRDQLAFWETIWPELLT